MEEIKPGDVLHQYVPMFSVCIIEPKDLKVVSTHIYAASVELVLEDGNVLKGYRGSYLSNFTVK